MTRISYKINAGDRHKNYRVDISGHSGYSAYGSDIVCSAISMLFAAAGQQLWEYDRENSFLRYECMLNAGEGHIEATVNPEKENGAKVEAVFEMLKTGMEMIAEIYPENVDFMR